MLKLMQPMPSLPSENPLHYYHYSESDKWTVSETEIFHQALLKHDKDFAAIAQEVHFIFIFLTPFKIDSFQWLQVETKTIKQCIQFYYVWKKVCTDEYKELKQMRERKSGIVKLVESELEEKPYPDAKLLGVRFQIFQNSFTLELNFEIFSDSRYRVTYTRPSEFHLRIRRLLSCKDSILSVL